MEIIVANDRVLLFKDQLHESEAEEFAKKHKTDAFGAFHMVSNFLSKPKDEDFQLMQKARKYMPFWHIAGTAVCAYERTVEHEWPTGGLEVKSLTLEGKDYTVGNGNVYMTVLEHCKQEENVEMFVEGITAAKKPDLKKYLSFTTKEMQKDDMQKLSETNIVIAPHARASAFVRDIASKMIHSIEADKILEEKVEFQQVDLYYRPVFVFKYKWLSKNKESVVEIDALTGQISYTQENIGNVIGKVFDYDFMFDVGKDAAGMFIPGGSIAVKIAKRYMDVTKKKS